MRGSNYCIVIWLRNFWYFDQVVAQAKREVVAYKRWSQDEVRL